MYYVCKMYLLNSSKNFNTVYHNILIFLNICEICNVSTKKQIMLYYDCFQSSVVTTRDLTRMNQNVT